MWIQLCSTNTCIKLKHYGFYFIDQFYKFLLYCILYLFLYVFTLHPVEDEYNQSITIKNVPDKATFCFKVIKK